MHRAYVESVLAVARVSLALDAFVFSHEPDGRQPWRPNYATLAFGRLVKEQGLTGIRQHDLRHFAATAMLVSGIDVRTASGRLGHANASTTLDVYAHVVKAADERAASAVAGVLDERPPVSADRRTADELGAVPAVRRPAARSAVAICVTPASHTCSWPAST